MFKLKILVLKIQIWIGGYFTKPYSEDILLNIVAKTLGMNHKNKDISQVSLTKNIPQTRFLH